MISQENNFDLSDGTGIMDCNIQLPVSPGQVNGQQFTLYQTSGQYADITATVFSNLVEKDIEQTLQSLNAIAINGDASRLYTGLSFGISANVGGLYNNKVYEMADIGNIEIDLQSTRTSSCTLNATFDGTEMTVTVKTGSGFIYPGAVISGTGLANDIYVIEQVSGPTGGTGVYIVDHDFITVESFTGLISNTGIVRVVIGDNTNTIYENMPITFSGIGLGGIVILDRKIADKRIFPAIDITKSGTRKEDLLFKKEDLQKMNVLRRLIAPMGNMEAIEFLIGKLRETKNNAEFFDSMNKTV